MFPVAPTIDRAFLQDLVVKAGERISFEVPIEAAPRPKASWTVDGKPVGTRADMMTTNTATSFEIPFAARSDTGRYQLTLKNELGECSASAYVTVLGKMSPD